MVDLWEEHTAYEFEDHSTEMTLDPMTDDPVNINVPLLTGGVGLEEARKYYSEYFIPKNLPGHRDHPPLAHGRRGPGGRRADPELHSHHADGLDAARRPPDRQDSLGAHPL